MDQSSPDQPDLLEVHIESPSKAGVSLSSPAARSSCFKETSFPQSVLHSYSTQSVKYQSNHQNPSNRDHHPAHEEMNSLSQVLDRKHRPEEGDTKIFCGKHAQEVVLFCLRAGCTHKRLICPKCVGDELTHITNHSPLTNTEDLHMLLAGEPGLREKFQSEINDAPKLEFNGKQIIEELIAIGEPILQETLGSIFDKIENQNRNFIQMQRNLEYLGLEKEKHILDNTQSSELLEQTLANLHPEKMDEFIKSLVKNKAEKEALLNYQLEYINRCIELNKSAVQSILENPPCFQAENLLQVFTSYIKQTFDELVLETETENKTSKLPKFIDLKIDKLEELDIFTNENICPMTRLKVDLTTFLNISQKVSVLSRISCLPLHGLEIDSRWTQIGPDLPYFLPATLTFLNLDFSSAKLTQKILHTLWVCFECSNQTMINDEPSIKRMRYLRLGMCNNSLTSKEVRWITNILCFTTNLLELELDLRTNLIDSDGACNLVRSLKSLIWLEKLNLDFGCFSMVAGSNKLELSFYEQFEPNASLQVLRLGLGNTGLKDQSLKMLCHKIIHIPRLVELALELYGNSQLTPNSLYILAKNISRIKCLRRLSLNFSSIPLNKEIIWRICEKLKEIRELESLSLKLKSCVEMSHEPEIRKKCLSTFGKSFKVAIEF